MWIGIDWKSRFSLAGGGSLFDHWMEGPLFNSWQWKKLAEDLHSFAVST